MKVAIIIPVYNEDKYLPVFIPKLIKQVKKLPEIQKIIFVNDGSSDRTGKILESYKNSLFMVISHSDNKGKGAAMRTGLQLAMKLKYDAVVFMDADCQHNPKHIPQFLNDIKRYPIVFGYRKLGNTAPLLRKIGNDIVRFIFRTLFSIKRQDLLCGFNAIRKDLFDKISWKSDDYGVEVEISTIIGKKNISSKEVLIDTIYLDTKKGITVANAIFILLKVPLWYIRY